MRSAKAVLISPFALDALSDSASGEVHSVFERTFNIIIGEKLVGIARSDISLSPIDLVTNIPSSKTMQSLGVRKGMLVHVAGGLVHVGEVLEISLSRAKIWRPSTRVEEPLSSKLITRNLELAKRSAAGKDGREGLGQLLARVDAIARGEMPVASELNEVARKALPHVVDLVKAARSGNIGGVENAAKDLIGLGPGLSPSADDMLSGVTCALWWVSHSLNRGVDRVETINQVISSQASSTTLLSKQLLQHAAHGEVNERVGELLKALLEGEPSEIEPLVERVMKIGETSGMDMMVGLLLGVQLGLEFKDY